MRKDLLKVLTMLKEGKLNIDKSADLIEAMYDNEEKGVDLRNNYDNRILKVIIESSNDEIVRVNLPVEAIRGILKSTGKLPIKNEKIEGIDFEILSESILMALDNEMLGEIVTVDSTNGDTVRIFIE